jgi:hypothetical protein
MLMRKSILLVLSAVLLVIAGYSLGSRNTTVAHASAPIQGTVPKSYGRLVTAISDQIGTGLIFEDAGGVIRFVAMTGMKEGELARYDQTPIHGGIPKSYGHLVAAVTNPTGTGLVFEDSHGVIRFVTITGKDEGELTRN